MGPPNFSFWDVAPIPQNILSLTTVNHSEDSIGLLRNNMITAIGQLFRRRKQAQK